MRAEGILAAVAVGPPATGLAGAAGAGGGNAKTKVTIKAPGRRGLRLREEHEAEPVRGRPQGQGLPSEGRPPGGGDDIKVGSDFAEAQGDGYEWNFGKPGVSGKKIYAKANKIAGCQGDRSKVIRGTDRRGLRPPSRAGDPALGNAGLEGLEPERLDRPQRPGAVRVAGGDALLSRPGQRLARERVAVDALGANGGEHLAGGGEGLGHEP